MRIQRVGAWAISFSMVTGLTACSGCGFGSFESTSDEELEARCSGNAAQLNDTAWEVRAQVLHEDESLDYVQTGTFVPGDLGGFESGGGFLDRSDVGFFGELVPVGEHVRVYPNGTKEIVDPLWRQRDFDGGTYSVACDRRSGALRSAEMEFRPLSFSGISADEEQNETYDRCVIDLRDGSDVFLTEQMVRCEDPWLEGINAIELTLTPTDVPEMEMDADAP